MSHDQHHDDGKPWGHIAGDGKWYPLPKPPLLMANLGPPPFAVTLPDGRVRHVIHNPADAEAKNKEGSARHEG